MKLFLLRFLARLLMLYHVVLILENIERDVTFINRDGYFEV